MPPERDAFRGLLLLLFFLPRCALYGAALGRFLGRFRGGLKLVRSAMEPDTMVAAVAQNTVWNSAAVLQILCRDDRQE